MALISPTLAARTGRVFLGRLFRVHDASSVVAFVGEWVVMALTPQAASRAAMTWVGCW